MLRYFLSFFVALALILSVQSFVHSQREAQYAALQARAREEAQARAPKPLPALTDSLATLSQPAVAKRAAAPMPAREEPQFVADPARLNPGAVVPARSQPVKELAAAPAARRAAVTPRAADPAPPASIATAKRPAFVPPPADPKVVAAIALWAPLETVAAAPTSTDTRAALGAVLALYVPPAPQASPLPALRLEGADFTVAAAATLAQVAPFDQGEREALVAWLPAFGSKADAPAAPERELAAVPLEGEPAAPTHARSESILASDLGWSLPAGPEDLGFSALTLLVGYAPRAERPRIESLFASDLLWSLPAGPDDLAFSALTLLVGYAPRAQAPETVMEAAPPAPVLMAENLPARAVSAAKRRLAPEEVALLVARLERSEQERVEPTVLPVAAVRRPKGLGLLPIMNPSARPLQPGEDPLPEADEPAAPAQAKPLPASSFTMPLGLRWGWQSKRVLRFNAFSFPDAEIEQEVREGGDGAIAVRGITECGPWGQANYEFGTSGLRKAVFVHQPTGPHAPAQAIESMRCVRDAIRNVLGAGEVVLRYEAQPSKSDPTVLETLSIIRWSDGDTVVQLDHFAAEQGAKRYDAVTLTCTRR